MALLDPPASCDLPVEDDDDDDLPALIAWDHAIDEDEPPTLTFKQKPTYSAPCEYALNAFCAVAPAPVMPNPVFSPNLAAKAWIERRGKINYSRLRRRLDLIQKHDTDRCIAIDGVAVFPSAIAPTSLESNIVEVEPEQHVPVPARPVPARL